jgi:hypothetical protein
LWRVRRRRARLEAWLHRANAVWELSFHHNNKLLISRSFATERSARAEAKKHLQDLERAGWTQHW